MSGSFSGRPGKERALRQAAAVLVHERVEPPRLLWTRRAAANPFAGGFHALPGGRLEAGDESVPNTGGPDAAFRVAALRELLEETGVLCTVGGPVDDAERRWLRRAFREDRTAAAERMREHGLRFRTADMEPMGRWVTPEHAPVDVLYDTQMFTIGVDGPLAPVPDDHEIDRAELVTAPEALARWERGEILIGPPLCEALRVVARTGRVDADAMRTGPGADGSEHLRWEVVPGVAMLPLRTPTLPPATHTNTFLVGTGDALLVEPASPWPEELDLAERWVTEARARGITVRAIVATHHHADHIGGAIALKERLGLPLWGHRLTAERLEGTVAFERLIEDGEDLEIDGPTPMTLTAVHTPGHAPGHLCFVDSASSVMIAGDMVAGVGTIIVEPVDGDMALYLASLRTMAEREPAMLLPAHGDPIRDSIGKLDQYTQHRLWREEKVLAALAAAAEPSLVEDLVPAAYDDADPRVWPLACGSLEAHLIKLEDDGRVTRQGRRWVVR